MTNSPKVTKNQEISTTTENKTVIKKPRYRSPNYPIYGLEEAITLAEKVYKEYEMQPIPIDMAGKLWGFKEKSGHILQVVATLNSYGLTVTHDSLDKRKIQISAQGEHIIRKAPNYTELIKKSALEPKIFKTIWEKSKGIIPKPDLLDRDLEWGEDFNFKIKNQRTRQTIIKNYSDTIKFAKLLLGGKIDVSESGGDDMPFDNSLEGKQKLDSLGAKSLPQDFFVLESKLIGSLKIRYPMTEQKVKVIQDFINAESTESGIEPKK